MDHRTIKRVCLVLTEDGDYWQWRMESSYFNHAFCVESSATLDPHTTKQSAKQLAEYMAEQLGWEIVAIEVCRVTQRTVKQVSCEHIKSLRRLRGMRPPYFLDRRV